MSKGGRREGGREGGEWAKKEGRCQGEVGGGGMKQYGERKGSVWGIEGTLYNMVFDENCFVDGGGGEGW